MPEWALEYRKTALLPLLLVTAAFGHPSGVDLDNLAKQFPEFQKGLLRYGHHFLHGKNRHHSLLKHTHNVHQRQELDAEADADADEKSAQLPMTLPGRHPSVEKALDGMADDLESLKETKLAAKESRSKLEGQVTDTMHHMNDAMKIKQAMHKQESKVRIDSGKLEVLEKDAGRLEQTHDSLVSSLHRMLGPKIMLARDRYQKKDAIYRKEQAAAHAWSERKEQLKAGAMELINKKKVSYQSLLEAEAEVAAAKKKEELARIQYEHDRTATAEQVQSYRYAETRYKAELQHEQAAETAARAARESVEKLFHVEKEEEQKVDQSILYRKEKLRRKMHEIEEDRSHSSDELTGLQNQYRDWKEQQRERTAEVMKKSQETAVASEAYQARQQQVLDAARAKVVREAEGETDWDAWGNDFTKTTDEDDE